MVQEAESCARPGWYTGRAGVIMAERRNPLRKNPLGSKHEANNYYFVFILQVI